MQAPAQQKVYCFLLKLVEMRNLARGVKKCHGVLAHTSTKRVCDRKVGDSIKFLAGRYNSLLCELTNVAIFDNVGSAFDLLSFKDFVPQFTTRCDALKYYCYLSSKDSVMSALTSTYVRSWDTSVGINPTQKFYVWSLCVIEAHFDNRQKPPSPIFMDELMDAATKTFDEQGDDEDDGGSRPPRRTRQSEATRLLDDNMTKLTAHNASLERRIDKLEKEVKELKNAKPAKPAAAAPAKPSKAEIAACVVKELGGVNKAMSELKEHVAKVECVVMSCLSFFVHCSCKRQRTKVSKSSSCFIITWRISR